MEIDAIMIGTEVYASRDLCEGEEINIFILSCTPTTIKRLEGKMIEMQRRRDEELGANKEKTSSGVHD